VLVVLLAGSVRRDVLVARTDTILSEVCYSRLLVLLGLLAAVVSSAISNMAAAPRLLQAMAQVEKKRTQLLFSQVPNQAPDCTPWKKRSFAKTGSGQTPGKTHKQF
jgi:hypothetical protein